MGFFPLSIDVNYGKNTDYNLDDGKNRSKLRLYQMNDVPNSLQGDVSENVGGQ